MRSKTRHALLLFEVFKVSHCIKRTVSTLIRLRADWLKNAQFVFAFARIFWGRDLLNAFLSQILWYFWQVLKLFNGLPLR